MTSDRNLNAPGLGPVLVVDDEQAVRTMFVRTLEDAGYRTAAAEDGTAALAAMVRERPSLVLLDITMPGLDGVEVVKAIRARDSGATIPIILVTALAQVQDRVHGLEAGADDYIAKPVALDELVARVAAHLRASRAWEMARDAGAREAAERKGSRLIQLTSTESALDSALRAAGDEASVFRAATGLLASVRGIAVAYIALAEPTGFMRVHSVHGDPEHLPADGEAAGIDSVQPIRAPIAWALETGDVFVHSVNEPNESAGESTTRSTTRIASEAVVPIRAGSFPLGVLVLQAEEMDFFGEAEVKLLERAANMIARRLGEIEHHERERALTAALEAERRQAERFANLAATVDQALAGVFRAADVYLKATQLPVELGVCALAWFGLIQSAPGGPRLRAVAIACQVDAPLAARIRRRPEAFMGEPATPSDRMTVIGDVLADRRLRGCHDALSAAGLRSMVFAPVFAGMRPAGGITFYGAEVGSFGAREVALLERLAANVTQRLAVIEAERRVSPRRAETRSGLSATGVAGSSSGARSDQRPSA